MTDHPPYASVLAKFEKQKDFFVGVDSDGCVFNSMEVKHNDCFSVAFVRAYELAAISREVHEVWDFVNLYSQTRGCNRFTAIAKVCDRLRERPRVQRVGVEVPELKHLKEWMETETKLGNSALEWEVERSTGERRTELSTVLEWSLLVNELVKVTVKRLPPFEQVSACLERLQEGADTMVVSSTPVEVLEREWALHRIDRFVSLIAGQEMGPKSEQLAVTTRTHYPPGHVLMIGDAPGDLQAARSVDALFYPIIPAQEEQAWERLYDEAIARFFNETYQGAYEDALIADFMQRLPENPPWETL